MILLQTSPTIEWANAVSELSLAAVILLGFALFVYALLSGKIVTGPRFQEMEGFYQQRVADLERQVEQYEASDRERHGDLVRLTDDFKQVIRDLISARLRDLSGG